MDTKEILIYEGFDMNIYETKKGLKVKILEPKKIEFFFRFDELDKLEEFSKNLVFALIILKEQKEQRNKKNSSNHKCCPYRDDYEECDLCEDDNCPHK